MCESYKALLYVCLSPFVSSLFLLYQYLCVHNLHSAQYELFLFEISIWIRKLKILLTAGFQFCQSEALILVWM